MTIENLAKAATISKELKMCDYIIEHGTNEADVLNLEFVNNGQPEPTRIKCPNGLRKNIVKMYENYKAKLLSDLESM